MAKKEKVTLSIDAGLVAWVDAKVREGEYESRSAALEQGMRLLAVQREETEYEQALALLDPEQERAEAEVGMAGYSAMVLSTTGWEGRA